MTRSNGGPTSRPAPRIDAERAEPARRGCQVVGEDDDHQDLGELAELELRPEVETQRADPPTPPPIASVSDEQAELDDVERPGERLQPVVVEGGRDEEDDDGDARSTSARA